MSKDVRESLAPVFTCPSCSPLTASLGRASFFSGVSNSLQPLTCPPSLQCCHFKNAMQMQSFSIYEVVFFFPSAEVPRYLSKGVLSSVLCSVPSLSGIPWRAYPTLLLHCLLIGGHLDGFQVWAACTFVLQKSRLTIRLQ